jgi:hypothetical protein
VREHPRFNRIPYQFPRQCFRLRQMRAVLGFMVGRQEDVDRAPEAGHRFLAH